MSRKRSISRFAKLMSLILALITPTATVGASFDCNLAATETEIAICENDRLSTLDELMASLYAQALRSNDWKYSSEDRDDSSVIADQRAAIQRQISCSASVECLNEFYTNRISSLSDQISPSEIDDLLALADYIDDQTDLRDFVTDPINGIAALLVSIGNPDEIWRAASGTVYNYNPSQIIIKSTDAQSGEISISDTLPLIDSTSLGAWLETAPNTVTLLNEHTRGWDRKVYEKNWDGWYLSYYEGGGVMRPGGGYREETYSDFELNFTVTSASYIYLNCSITLTPSIGGDYNSDALRDLDGWEDHFNLWSNEMTILNHSDFVHFLDNMNNRELRLYASEAFSAGKFNVSKAAFERLVDRGYPNSENDLACVIEAIENQ